MPFRRRSSRSLRSIASRGAKEKRLSRRYNITIYIAVLQVITEPVIDARFDRGAGTESHPGCFHRVFATAKTVI